MTIEIVVPVSWHFNNERMKIEAWLPGQTKIPSLSFGGAKAFNEENEFLKMFDRRDTEVFQGDLTPFFNHYLGKAEHTLNMRFFVIEQPLYPNSQYFNCRIGVEWKELATTKSGSIGPFNYSIAYNMVNGPQWFLPKKEKGSQYVDILFGNLVPVFKNMVENRYRELVEDKYTTMIDGIKRQQHKKELSQKKAVEIRDAIKKDTPHDGAHNGFCTRCNMYYSLGHDQPGEDVVYGCSIGVFAPFHASDLTEDIYERYGCSSDGDILRSNRGDALWAYVTPEDQVADVALSHSDLMRIGRIIDSDSRDLGSSMELTFADLEFLYDDVNWIDRLSKKGLIDDCDDLDATIQTHRDELLIRLQRRYAGMFPAYADLFLQRTTVSHQDADLKAQDDVVLEEVGEKAHKVNMNAFLDSYVFGPCAYGSTSKKGTDGKWKTYLYRGYPLPTEFNNDLIEKL